jgi:hypothetical protein
MRRGDGERAFLSDTEGLVASQVSSSRLRRQHSTLHFPVGAQHAVPGKRPWHRLRQEHLVARTIAHVGAIQETFHRAQSAAADCALRRTTKRAGRMPALRNACNSRSLTAVRKKRERVRDDNLEREAREKDGELKPAATRAKEPVSRWLFCSFTRSHRERVSSRASAATRDLLLFLFVGRGFSLDIMGAARSAFLCAASIAEGLAASWRAASVRFFSGATKDGEPLFHVADASVAAHEALAAARQRDGSGAGGVYGFSDGQNSAETGRHDPARRFRVGSFGDCVQAGDVLGLCNFRRGRMRTVLVGSRLERSNFSRARSLCAGLNREAERCQRQ